MPLGMEVGLVPGDFLLDGDPSPLPKRDSPQFSAHVYCGQTAGWIKMALGMEVGLGPGYVVSRYNRTVQARDLHTGATVHLWRATVHP